MLDNRFKIIVEGRAWSVSSKYILACDSPALFVTTHFHDFMTRGLMPGRHYWPIREDNQCRSIKFAVEWGNKNQEKVSPASTFDSFSSFDQSLLNYL